MHEHEDVRRDGETDASAGNTAMTPRQCHVTLLLLGLGLLVAGVVAVRLRRRSSTGGRLAMSTRRDRIGGVSWHTTVAEPSAPATRTPLVLVHGMVVADGFHAPLMERLRGDFRIFAPDLPGYGRSDRPRPPLAHPALVEALRDWMEVLGLRRVLLMGTSHGSQVAADFAALYPEHVERLVLVSPVLEPSARPLASMLLRFAREARHEWRMAQLLAREYVRAGPRATLTIVRAVRRHRLERVAPLVQAPTLVVRGTRDPLLSSTWAHEVTRLFRHGRLVELPGVPHAMNYLAPGPLSEAVRPFLLGE